MFIFAMPKIYVAIPFTRSCLKLNCKNY